MNLHNKRVMVILFVFRFNKNLSLRKVILEMLMRYQTMLLSISLIKLIAPIWPLGFVCYTDVSILKLFWLKILFSNEINLWFKDFVNFHVLYQKIKQVILFLALRALEPFWFVVNLKDVFVEIWFEFILIVALRAFVHVIYIN